VELTRKTERKAVLKVGDQSWVKKRVEHKRESKPYSTSVKNDMPHCLATNGGGGGIAPLKLCKVKLQYFSFATLSAIVYSTNRTCKTVPIQEQTKEWSSNSAYDGVK
jgi:hypothetical protein